MIKLADGIEGVAGTRLLEMGSRLEVTIVGYAS